MKGYLLILTSGILFFIIAVVTVLHLMSAKALNQQYQLNDIYQDVLNRESIKSFVSFLIEKNASSFQLPLDISNNYELTSESLSDGSSEFVIKNLATDRVSTFNVSKINTQSSGSIFNLAGVAVNSNQITGVGITSSSPTTLVSIRSVWYPFNVEDTLISYTIDTDGQRLSITPNITMGEVVNLASPMTGLNRSFDLNFSALPQTGAVSIYFKYSDGSIKNAHIEF
ncbi:MAG: hypothetical protein VW397_08475 [Candidatus Margulisiibacteriota bacterium]